MDRIRLALFVEWGLISEDRARKLPPRMQAEILLTELAIAVRQSGMNSVAVAEKFAFPRLQNEDTPSPAVLKTLLEDKLRMHAMIAERQKKQEKPKIQDKAKKKLVRGFADAAINVLTKPKTWARSTLSVMSDVAALRQVWDIVTAKGPAETAEDYIDRMCKELRSDYANGFTTMRRAQRQQLRDAGIPYESVMVPKPEGGHRHIVRPKPTGPAPA